MWEVIKIYEVNALWKCWKYRHAVFILIFVTICFVAWKNYLLIVRCLNLDNKNSYLPPSKDILEGAKQNTKFSSPGKH